MITSKGLHIRNIHNDKYDFDVLIYTLPKLSSFVNKDKYNNLTIDFSNANAVICLNEALLLHHYKVKKWSIAKGHLCPGVPGRADYLHYIADLLADNHGGIIPVGTKIKGLDIGAGASCIYPILGNSIYGWKFVGTDIDRDIINHAKNILNFNQTLKKNIKMRFQKSINNIFAGMIKSEESFDFTMCNPPFFSSLEEARDASIQKIKNLNINKEKKKHSSIKIKNTSNFGGKKAELWCTGGEQGFIKKMINESVDVKSQCRWFSTLVSNKKNIIEFLKKLEGYKCRTSVIEMSHGKKKSHILAWSFF